MNIAHHKGQPQDQSAGPATVSTPRAVVRKSPSPLPALHVRGRTPERSRAPVRKSRPTTRTERFEDSRSSHSSRLPDRWLDSPLDFQAAIQADDTEKTSSASDGEDEGSSRKVSSAQYALFRQAVTLSKGAFKIVPARTKRAARASLLDLGEEEKTDKFSWMDQPSLLDTMASTARIAQGLKDDEEVDKTTLSEMLNAESSKFKHFTVKQVFPREPYRLKMHKNALYQAKPGTDKPRNSQEDPPYMHLSWIPWSHQWFRSCLPWMRVPSYSRRS